VLEETRFDRTDQFAKDWNYEQLLERLNLQVEDLEDPGRAQQEADEPTAPVVFIMGIPRSGSTLLYQLISESGAFGYCSNLIARFYRNPAFGLRIQRLLDPVLPDDEMTWESEFGLTDRWYEPHEFGYFWERHLPFEDHHEPTEAQLADVDWAAFRRDIAAFQQGFGGPVVFKNLSLDFVVEPIAREIESAKFVRISRDPLSVAASIYRGRCAYYDNEDAWFSTRPRNFEALGDEAPVDQIVAQMTQIRDTLDRAAAELSDDRWAEVTYESVCEDPNAAVADICDGLGVSSPPHTLPDEFEASGVRGPDEVVDKLRAHFSESRS
jgi:LPS sulfotransferase NodH